MADTSRTVVRRTELADAYLIFGDQMIDLQDYATTGLRVVAIGPSGVGKTNAGLLIGEQLADQGWISVLVDPEGEIESMYGDAVDASELQRALEKRDRKIVVVSARDATEFIPFGRVIFEAADTHRQPIFVMLDEGQVFSASRKRKNDIGTASDLVNELAQRGRKRALDLFMTATSFTGSLHRHIFANKNLSLIGCQEDPAAWAALAPSQAPPFATRLHHRRSRGTRPQDRGMGAAAHRRRHHSHYARALGSPQALCHRIHAGQAGARRDAPPRGQARALIGMDSPRRRCAPRRRLHGHRQCMACRRRGAQPADQYRRALCAHIGHGPRTPLLGNVSLPSRRATRMAAG